MKLALLILTSALLSSTQVEAQAYHRFWRGSRRSDLSAESFKTALNQVFIGKTIKVGAGKGLIAYQPVLTAQLKGLPDEVALVSYQNQDIYRALFQITAGIRYQNLHWNYFERSLSHSVEVEAFHGEITLEHAYDLHPAYQAWTSHFSTFKVAFREPGESASQYLARAKNYFMKASLQDSPSLIFDRVFLVSEKYWIEYLSTSFMPLKDSGTAIQWPLSRTAVEQVNLNAGSGVNVQWIP